MSFLSKICSSIPLLLSVTSKSSFASLILSIDILLKNEVDNLFLIESITISENLIIIVFHFLRRVIELM